MFDRIKEYVKSTSLKTTLRDALRHLLTLVYYPPLSFKEYIAKTCTSDSVSVLLFSCKIKNTIFKVKVVDDDNTLFEFNKLTRKYRFHDFNIIRALLKRRDILITDDGVIVYKELTRVVIDRIVCISYDIATSCLKFKCRETSCQVFITLDKQLINFLISVYRHI